MSSSNSNSLAKLPKARKLTVSSEKSTPRNYLPLLPQRPLSLPSLRDQANLQSEQNNRCFHVKQPDLEMHDMPVSRSETVIVRTLDEISPLSCITEVTQTEGSQSSHPSAEKADLPLLTRQQALKSNFHESSTTVDFADIRPAGHKKRWTRYMSWWKNRSTTAACAIVAIAALVIMNIALLVLTVTGTEQSFWTYFTRLPLARQTLITASLAARYLPPRSDTASPILKPFSGIIYEPISHGPTACTYSTLSAMKDLSLLAPLTATIRTTSLQCNQIEHIIEAIETLNLDLTILLGLQINSDETSNAKEVEEAKRILLGNPQQRFEAVFVGSDSISSGFTNEHRIVELMRDLQEVLNSNNLSIPVGTADIGTSFSKGLVRNSDIVGINLKPFASGVSADAAVNWSTEFMRTVVEPMNERNRTIVISEIGWPSSGESIHRAEATMEEFEKFVKSWICAREQTTQQWFHREAFDRKWSMNLDREPENFKWGLFDDRQDLKFNPFLVDC